MKGFVIVMIIITLSSSSARILTPNSVSALQEILSPANTDKAIQLINIAAQRANRIARPETARVICGEAPIPARLAYEMPRAVVANEMPARIASEGYRVVNPELLQRMLRPAREEVAPNFSDSLVIPKEIFQAYSVPQESAQPCPPPAPAFNPYLPIASPVSAMSPGNLPPPTQSRGQFLRKIPIPPPSL